MDRVQIATSLLSGWLASYPPDGNFPSSGECQKQCCQVALEMADTMLQVDRETSQSIERAAQSGEAPAQQLKPKMPSEGAWYDFACSHGIEPGQAQDAYIWFARHFGL